MQPCGLTSQSISYIIERQGLGQGPEKVLNCLWGGVAQQWPKVGKCIVGGVEDALDEES